MAALRKMFLDAGAGGGSGGISEQWTSSLRWLAREVQSAFSLSGMDGIDGQTLEGRDV